MKEVLSMASNIILTEKPNDNGEPSGKVRALLEMVIIVSEPKHTEDQAGEAVRFRQTENLRFCGNASTMKRVSEYILERFEELEAAEKRINDDKPDELEK